MHSVEQHILETEEKVHDKFSQDFSPEAVPVDDYFRLPSCPENRFILKHLPDLEGKRLLDIGAGTGESAVYFAKMGAQVTAIDISQGMLDIAQQVARHHNVSIETIKMDGGALNFPQGSFDIIYGANVLHHINTKQSLLKVKDLLREGGTAAFWDPIAYNPVINIYRKIAYQVRSPDEHPLRVEDYQFMKENFREVHAGFFWFFTLGVFLKFYLWDMIHPNEERYWKKIITDYESIASLYESLETIDKIIGKIPALRWLAWNMAVVLKV